MRVRAGSSSLAVPPDVKVPTALSTVREGWPVTDRDAGASLCLAILVSSVAIRGRGELAAATSGLACSEVVAGASAASLAVASSAFGLSGRV